MSRRILHPVLFGAFPVVFLWAQNLDEGVSLGDVILPLVVATLGGAALFLFLRLLLRDPPKAGFLGTGLLILFFSFGHVQQQVDPFGMGTKEGSLLILYGSLLLLVMWVAFRIPAIPRASTAPLNAVAAVLLTANLVPIVRHELAGGSADLPGAPLPTGLHVVGQPRDIYYLIFDRYPNERVLLEQYGFDNSAFLDGLRERGFYVAHDSAANHLKTTESLASSLNMMYLDDLARAQGSDSGDWGPVSELLRWHRVGMILKQLGYRYYHMGSWWTVTKDSPLADVDLSFRSVSEFSEVLIRTTAWPTISETLGFAEGQSFEETQYRRVLDHFEKLARMPEVRGPTFTFAHFTLPHEPFVFDAAGRYVRPEEAARRSFRDNFIDQLIYTNGRIIELVDSLLAGTDETDPIIVIQSDEGPHPARYRADEEGFRWPEATDAELQEKMLILNAYYLPEVGEPPLYPAISPVNTFRVIFDLYFGGDLALLPDRSWVFEDSSHPYDLTEVTDRLH